MYTPIMRLILILNFLIFGVLFYLKHEYVGVALVLLGIICVIYGHFKYGSVYLAFKLLQKGDIEDTQKLMLKIKHPEKLNPKQKSYYYFIWACIAYHKAEFDKSYDDFNKAYSIGLRTENDQAIALFNMASIEHHRKNIIQAKELLKEVNTLNYKPSLKENIDQLEKEIAFAEATNQSTH